MSEWLIFAALVSADAAAFLLYVNWPADTTSTTGGGNG